MKNLYIVIAATLFSLLAACGDGEEKFTSTQLKQAVATATSQATTAEANKADAKLAAAKAELKKLAVDTARQGGFSATANCNILPAGFNATSAIKNFPSSAPGEYRAVCTQEVALMNSERKTNANRAIAKAKQTEAKLAAAKAKQAEEARRVAASKAKAKPQQKG